MMQWKTLSSGMLLSFLALASVLGKDWKTEHVRETGAYTYRYLGLFKVFSISRFAEELGVESETPGEFDLVFHYHRNFGADQIVKAGDKALREEFSESELTAYAASLELLNAAYRDIEKGDEYRLSVRTEGRLTLFLNEEKLVELDQPGFGWFYTKIWLGDRDACSPIKESLLP